MYSHFFYFDLFLREGTWTNNSLAFSVSESISIQAWCLLRLHLLLRYSSKRWPTRVKTWSWMSSTTAAAAKSSSSSSSSSSTSSSSSSSGELLEKLQPPATSCWCRPNPTPALLLRPPPRPRTAWSRWRTETPARRLWWSQCLWWPKPSRRRPCPTAKPRRRWKTMSKRKISQQKEKKATQMLAIVLGQWIYRCIPWWPFLIDYTVCCPFLHVLPAD